MRYRCQWDGEVYEVVLERKQDRFQAIIDGNPVEVEILDSQPGELSLSFNGNPMTIVWAAQERNKWVSLEGCSYQLQPPLPTRSRRLGESEEENSVRAPMPAQVRELYAITGEPVEKGETLMLLEAMKMEIRVLAPRSGRVRTVLVSIGDTVNRDQVLVEISD
jgi:biotin carboxyl carrier protein